MLKSNDKVFILYILTILIYFLIVGAQGLDMCDEGWVMTGYQQLFNDAESVTYQLLYYLTLLVGAVWNKFFGWLGYYGFRILSALILTSTCALIYKTLEPYITKSSIIVGTIVCISFTNYGTMVFHHNHLTMFLITLTCYFLTRGIRLNNSLYFLLGGICVGLNLFSRLPNLTMCALITAIIPFYKRPYFIRKTLSLCILGFLCGVVIVVSVMYYLGHIDLFFDAIDMMQAASKDPLSTHDFSYMAKVYANHYTTIIYCTSLILILVFVAKKIQKSVNKQLQIIIMIFLIFIEYYIFRRFPPLSIVYGISTFVLLYACYRYKDSKQMMPLCIMALIWLHFLPIGSDFGIGNMGTSSIWLAIPLAIGIIQRNISNTKKERKHYLYIILIALVFPFITNVKAIANQCYFDTGNRLDKVYKVDNEKLNVYTTKKNKDILEPLLNELPKYVNNGDYLLQYMKCPLIHYITETRPCLGNSWIWAYTPGLIDKELRKFELSGHKLPVIVREKSSIGRWYEYDETWDDDRSENTYEHKNEKITIINEFIAKHKYHIAWESEIFQILIKDASK